MSTLTIALLCVAGVVLVLGIIIYNGLINKKNQVENAFGGMDAQLKKRYDLIPNLISSVQQYMKHEREVLNQLTELRAKALTGNMSDNDKIDVNNQITRALGSILVAVEAYPDLKASENFLQLQHSLNEVEEQLSASRRAYNAAVTSYNNGVEMFPSNLVANMMGYDRKQVFEIPDMERQNVNVKSLFNT